MRVTRPAAGTVGVPHAQAIQGQALIRLRQSASRPPPPDGSARSSGRTAVRSATRARRLPRSSVAGTNVRGSAMQIANGQSSPADLPRYPRQ